MQLGESRFDGRSSQFLLQKRPNTTEYYFMVNVWSLGPDPHHAATKSPPKVAANRTGMAGADPLLIAPGSKRKLGLRST
jgi:hypothetical protein